MEEPRDKSPDRAAQRKGAIATAAILGPILLAGIVTLLTNPEAGALVLLTSWLVALLASVARTLRG